MKKYQILLFALILLLLTACSPPPYVQPSSLRDFIEVEDHKAVSVYGFYKDDTLEDIKARLSLADEEVWQDTAGSYVLPEIQLTQTGGEGWEQRLKFTDGKLASVTLAVHFYETAENEALAVVEEIIAWLWDSYTKVQSVNASGSAIPLPDGTTLPGMLQWIPEEGGNAVVVAVTKQAAWPFPRAQHENLINLGITVPLL